MNDDPLRERLHDLAPRPGEVDATAIDPAAIIRSGQRRRRGRLSALAVAAAVVAAGIAVPFSVIGTSSTTTQLTATGSLPANSPLTDCLDPTPATPKPVDTAVAQDFADGRLRTALSLDGGAFRAVSAPSDAAPKIGAALAFCNLLAGFTNNGSRVIDAAADHGLSFGLGVVTVADSVLKPGPRTGLVGAAQQTVSLQPYHARLAWIAVIKPDEAASCPAVTAPQPPPSVTLPAYQFLAIDADTGADGILYSAKTNAPCGGYAPASVAPAAESVSVPWTLVKRGTGPQSVSITYQARPCDDRASAFFTDTGESTASASPTVPRPVSVIVERTITTCGPAVSAQPPMLNSTLATELPQHPVHAAVGAQDVPAEDAGL